MPRLSIEDARAVGAAMEYALSNLSPDAPQRVDWERAMHRLQRRLDVALSQHAERRARQLNNRVHPSRGHRPARTPCTLKARNSSPAPMDDEAADQCTR